MSSYIEYNGRRLGDLRTEGIDKYAFVSFGLEDLIGLFQLGDDEKVELAGESMTVADLKANYLTKIVFYPDIGSYMQAKRLS